MRKSPESCHKKHHNKHSKKCCTKQWVIPLTDNLENPPAGHALVYLNAEETYNPPVPPAKEKVTLLGWDDLTITVTKVGKLVSIVTGTGSPISNLAWSQENDYSKLPNNANLVIDFTGTDVEKLIVNGGNHTILTVPYAYGSSDGPYLSKTGIAQVGIGGPIIKVFPENAPTYSGTATLNENGEAFITDAVLLTYFLGNIDIKLTVMPSQVPYGQVYVSKIEDNGFTIKSVAQGNDEGLQVGYSILYAISSWAYKGWPAGNNAIPDFHLTYALQDCKKPTNNNLAANVVRPSLKSLLNK